MGVLQIQQAGDLGFSPEQVDIIRSQVAPEGTTNDELALFLMYCQRTGLDPFARQIYLSERRSKKGDRWIVTRKPETTIDGFRLIAERTSKYAGQLGPFWCGEDGVWHDVWIPQEPPVAAKVGILRHDFKEPLWSVALYDEYVQKNSEGKPNSMWAKMPANQLAKCAESGGHRRAFPRELSGLYTREEMPDERTEPRETQQEVADRKIAEISAPKADPPATIQSIEERRAKTLAEADEILNAAASDPKPTTGTRKEMPSTGGKAPLNPAMLKGFQDIKAELQEVSGTDELYYAVLKGFGFDKSNKIPTRDKGVEIYKAMGRALASLRDTKRMREELAELQRTLPSREFWSICQGLDSESIKEVPPGELLALLDKLRGLKPQESAV